MREMKDSGVEWIGEIPSDWKVVSTKFLFDIFSGATPDSSNSEYWDGEIRWITPADYKSSDVYVDSGRRNLSQKGFESCSTSMIPVGSLIFSKRAPIGSVAINRSELCTNQGCLACACKGTEVAKYYYYVMSVAKLRDVTAVQTLSRLNRTTAKKNSTFILDFENTEEDIKDAFLPYYETTTLAGSTDLNQVYDLRNKIRDFMLYNYSDVDAFNAFMASQAGKNQDAGVLGKLAGMFRPVISRYMDLSEDDRFTARDFIRKFNKAYAFVTQLVRLHDRDLFNEYQYTLHLIRLLPRSAGDEFVDIEDKIKLEYASLTETFHGAIVLDEKPPVFVPNSSTAPKVPNKKMDTLQSIIDKVNERFSGNFTDSDRVIIEGIYQMFMKDSEVKKFKKYAKDNSTEMFVKSLFPDKFRDIVTQCFLDNNDSFAKLFNDPDFYQKVQDAMAAELYKALRKD